MEKHRPIVIDTTFSGMKCAKPYLYKFYVNLPRSSHKWGGMSQYLHSFVVLLALSCVGHPHGRHYTPTYGVPLPETRLTARHTTTYRHNATMPVSGALLVLLGRKHRPDGRLTAPGAYQMI